MAISLIVTKSIDENFGETGNEITLDEWLSLVERDPTLRIRTEPSVATSPAGKVSVPGLPGQSELVLGDTALPFLGYRWGKLVMKLTADMDDPSNPQRQKVAEVARRLGALICHDAGDEILRW